MSRMTVSSAGSTPPLAISVPAGSRSVTELFDVLSSALKVSTTSVGGLGQDRAVGRRDRLKLRVGQRDERQCQDREEHREDEPGSANPAPSWTWDHARSLRSKSGVGAPAIARGTGNGRPHADEPLPKAHARGPAIGRLAALRVAIPGVIWHSSRRPKSVSFAAQVGDVFVHDDSSEVFHRSLLHVRWISNS